MDSQPHPGVVSGPLSSRRRRRRPRWPHRPHRPHRPRWPRGRRWWLLAGAGLALAAGLFLLYLRQSLAGPVNSDGAATVLQGQALIAGNPLLRGWWTSDVSFYTTELPEYALMTAIRGVSPDVVHLCGALTYTLTVALTALVARGRARGARALPRMAVAAALTLAPSVLGGTEVFLENPDHAGTAVPVLLLLLLLDTPQPERLRIPPGRRPWLAPLGACLLLALAQVGDGLTLIAATLPVAAISLARLARGNRRPRSWRGDGALLGAALGAVVLAKLAGLLIGALGGYDQRPLAGVALARPGELRATAGVLWQSVILLFGANGPGTPRQPQTIKAHAVLVLVADLHVAGLLVAGAGLAAGIALCCSRRADRVTQVLVAALGAVLAAGLGTTVLRSLSNAHEVAILLPLAAALAGRVLPDALRSLTALCASALCVPALCVPALRVAAVALGGWLALSLAALCYGAAGPPARPAQQAAAAWLASKHQHEGLAGYWQASATTVASGGAVVVAPVTVSSGHAAADHWNASAAWYRPGQRATFVIAVAGRPAQAGALTVPGATKLFGRPAATRQAGQEVILLYGYNLLTRLAGR